MPLISSYPAASGADNADLLLIAQSGVYRRITVSLLLASALTSNTDLVALGAVSTTGVIERTGSGAFSTFAITAKGKAIVACANSAAVLSELGIGTLALQGAVAVAITGGTITGITDLAIADGGTGASNAAGARTNLGLGTMAVQAAGSVAITGGTITGITDLAIADGGTGASTAAGARTNLGLGTAAVLDVPLGTTAAAGEVVKGDDTRLTGSRTPSAHAASHATGQADAIAPSSIGALTAASNLSDVASASTARTNLGLGTAATVNVPASGDATSGQVVKGDDTRLTNARAASAHAANHATAGSDPLTAADVGALTRASNLSDIVTPSACRANLGLGTMATQDASAVAITGGTITGITDLPVAHGGTGSSNAAGARTNLGLGTMATQDASAVAITGGTITGITDLPVAHGGTGSSNAAGARTNLGLGTIATQDASAVAITGGTITGVSNLVLKNVANAFSALQNFDAGLAGVPQLITGSAAISLTTIGTGISTTAGAAANPLANGADGQVKVIAMVLDGGGNAVVTPAAGVGFTTITFANVGECAVLKFFTGFGWVICSLRGAIAA